LPDSLTQYQVLDVALFNTITGVSVLADVVANLLAVNVDLGGVVVNHGLHLVKCISPFLNGNLIVAHRRRLRVAAQLSLSRRQPFLSRHVRPDRIRAMYLDI